MKTHSTISLLLSLILVAVLGVAAGCDNKSAKNNNPAQPVVEKAAQPAVKKIVFDPNKPCQLLTKEEVSAALKAKSVDANDGAGHCYYSAMNPEYMSFEIMSSAPDDSVREFATSKKEVQDSVKKNRGEVMKKLEGIGDDAFYWGGDGDRSLYVLKGKYNLIFMARDASFYKISEEGIKALAKQAVDRI